MTGPGGGQGATPAWRDFRRYPATCGLGALWVAVYLGMCWDQGSLAGRGNPLSGGISIAAAHDFGSVSPAEVRSGEVWRALTATCVHFGILHIGMNLLVFSQVGRMVEEWYGSAHALALYVVIGGGGNLLACWAKLFRAGHEDDPSGGGSGVICGLIALAAVVGWRSRTRVGLLLSRGMVTALGSTALLGLLVPQVDNLAHAGGAIFGALTGLVHRQLVREARTTGARLLGALALAILVGCGAAQYLDTIAQHRLRRAFPYSANLAILRKLVQDESVAPGGRFSSKDRGTRRKALAGLVRAFEPRPGPPIVAGSDRDFATMLGLAKLAGSRRLTPGERRQFDRSWGVVNARVQGDIAESGGRLSSLRIFSRGPVRFQVGPPPNPA